MVPFDTCVELNNNYPMMTLQVLCTYLRCINLLYKLRIFCLSSNQKKVQTDGNTKAKVYLYSPFCPSLKDPRISSGINSNILFVNSYHIKSTNIVGHQVSYAKVHINRCPWQVWSLFLLQYLYKIESILLILLCFSGISFTSI